jgi:hypothetical protein
VVAGPASATAQIGQPALRTSSIDKHDRAVLFGWILAGIGLLFLVYPRPLVVAAKGWRLGMPSASEPGALRAARVGAVTVLVLGVVLALA